MKRVYYGNGSRITAMAGYHALMEAAAIAEADAAAYAKENDIV